MKSTKYYIAIISGWASFGIGIALLLGGCFDLGDMGFGHGFLGFILLIVGLVVAIEAHKSKFIFETKKLACNKEAELFQQQNFNYDYIGKVIALTENDSGKYGVKIMIFREPTDE